LLKVLKDQRKQSGDKLDDLNCATNVNVVRLSFRMDDSSSGMDIVPRWSITRTVSPIEKTSIQYTPRTDHQSTENGSKPGTRHHWQFPPDRLPDLVALRELIVTRVGKAIVILPAIKPINARMMKTQRITLAGSVKTAVESKQKMT